MDMTAEMILEGKRIRIWGEPASPVCFIQMTDDHDEEAMGEETAQISAGAGDRDWCLITVSVNSWNDELTPWKADPVFGKDGFGDGAGETLAFLTEVLLPWVNKRYPAEDREYYLGGYSLAGLFALWCGYQTDLFKGVAGVSPSVWYPGWSDYVKEHAMKAERVYLSLGDKEEKTRNRTMARVGDAIRNQYQILAEAGIKCTLEWNPGNHFRDSGKRTGRGLAWLIGETDETESKR